MKELIEEKTITLGAFYPDDGQSIDAFLADITQELTDLKARHYTADTVCDKLYPNHYGYDGAFDIKVEFLRLETDEEEQQRLEIERIKQEKTERTRLKKLENKRIKQAAKEEAERIEYERLKAKYGE